MTAMNPATKYFDVGDTLQNEMNRLKAKPFSLLSNCKVCGKKRSKYDHSKCSKILQARYRLENAKI